MFLGKLVKIFFYLFKIADDLVIYLSSTVESGIDYLYDLGQVLFNFTQFLCVYEAGLLLFHTITMRSEWDHTTHFPRDDGASTRNRALPELGEIDDSWLNGGSFPILSFTDIDDRWLDR